MDYLDKIITGDCLEVLAELPENSFDSVVTDPPYGISFMSKKWDYDVPQKETWAECLKVLKPGGHALIFGGTRTFHRLVVEIEDAGFEIRDTICYHYGSGFPKNMDVSKAIDLQAGAEREIIGEKVSPDGKLAGKRLSKSVSKKHWNYGEFKNEYEKTATIKAPATEDAKKWDGWGTALAPATELICLARKPISEKTIAANVLKWSTGGININGSRIGDEEMSVTRSDGNIISENKSMSGGNTGRIDSGHRKGRWPKNAIFDEYTAAELDRQSGIVSSGQMKSSYKSNRPKYGMGVYNDSKTMSKFTDRPGNSGGASRFFYVAKASKSEKNHLCENIEVRQTTDGRQKDADNAYQRGKTLRNNFHPTVKPIKLMKYLINLITPPGGIILDPFLGSGSTALASKELGFNFTGIDKDPYSVKIAEARLRQGYLF